MKQIVAIVLASVTFVTQSHGQGCCGSPGGSPSGSSGSSGSETAFFSGGGTTEEGHSMNFIVDGHSFSTGNGVSFGDRCNTLVNTTDATLPFTRGKTYSITASGWGNAWSVSLGVDAICPCKTEYLGPTHGTGFGSCAGPITGSTAIRIADDDDESAAEKENDPDSNSNPGQLETYNARYQNSAHVMVDSINWHFSLGGWLPDSKSPGHFALIKDVLDADTYKKSSLEFTTGASSTYVSQINDPASFPTSNLWQVVTPEWVVNIKDNSTNGGYDLNLYHKGQTTFDGTYWTNSSAPPAVKWSIQNPDVGAGLFNRLQIQKVRDGLTNTWLYQYSYTTTASGFSRVWTLTEEPSGSVKRITTVTRDLTSVTLASGLVGSHWDDTRIVTDGSGTRASKSVVTFEDRALDDGLGQPLTNTFFVAKLASKEWISGSGGSEVMKQTTYAYYDVNFGAAYVQEYGRVMAVTQPDGTWQRYYYEPYTGDSTSQTQVERVYERWLDTTYSSGYDSATNNNARSTERTYYREKNFRLSRILKKQEERIPSSASAGYSVISRKEGGLGYFLPNASFPEAYVLAETNKIWFQETSDASLPNGYEQTVTFRHGPMTGGPEAGRVSGKLFPDGRATTNQYVMGSFDTTSFTFTPDASSTNLQTTVDQMKWYWDGAAYAVGTEVGRSLRIETVQDPIGRVRVRKEYFLKDATPTYVLINETRYIYDSLDRLSSVTLNGRTIRSVTYSNDRVQTETDQDGTQTTFAYDALGRVQTKTKVGVSVSGSYASQADQVMTSTYDAADRVLSRTTTGGGLTLTQSSVYDGQGRITSQTDANALITTTLYQQDTDPADGVGDLVTTTRPNTGTEVRSYYLDGRLKSVTGTGSIARYLAYSAGTEVIPGSSPTGYYYILEEMEYTGVNNGPRYQRRRLDWEGRQFRLHKPAFATGTNEVMISFTTYDERGLRTLESPDGFGKTRFFYDALGTLSRQGVDLNANSTLDDASTDRITQYSEGYQQLADSNYYYVKTVNRFLTNSAALSLVRETRSQVTGLATTRKSRRIVVDPLANTTEFKEDVDRANKLVTRQKKLPTTTLYATTVIRNGLTVTETSDTQSTVRKFGYDGLGRQTTVTEPNGGVSTTVYVSSKNQVDSVTDAANSKETYGYGAGGALGAGQVVTITAADGTLKRREYDLLSRVIHEWGSSAYPIQYEFDANYGDLRKMTTYRDGTGWNNATWPGTGTADVTEWIYQDKTGLLTSKKDAAANSVVYTYYDTARYPLKNRKWARSSSPDVTYTYDAITGELTLIHYADATMTDVTLVYDRGGRVSQVTDAAGTRTLANTEVDKLDVETFTAGQFSGTVLDHSFDSFGRFTSLTGNNTASGSNLFTTVSMSYRTEGRVDKVTSGAMTWTYGYETLSDRITQVLSKNGSTVNVTENRTYDLLGRLVQIEEKLSSTAPRAASGYVYDSRNRRRQKVLEDGSVWNYQYDDRGEVTSGKRYWAGQTPVGGQQFVYDYDNIGNRKTTGRGGDGMGNGLRTETYTANALNQYTAASLSSSVDVVGVAYANVAANVSLNGGSATAASRQGEYFFTAAALGSSSASTSNEVSVVSSAGGSATKGAIYRPPLTQSLSYDLDGNLVSDGLWKYAWDSENRLAVMFMTNLTAGPRFQLEFQYDYQGRRIRKTVKARSIDASSWVVSSDVQFVYEGWNLMAELDVLSNKNVVRSYVWGLDLSGTPQKAGGIGGALGMRTGTAGTAQIYCYDGNGNVVGQVDSSSIAWSAQYEYGPFGEGIRSTGTGAKTNPFRFSTKYQDDESDLIYYGYRFYSASSGRWINRDPIEEAGGLNLNGFVYNDPLSYIDRDGLDLMRPPAQPPTTPPTRPPMPPLPPVRPPIMPPIRPPVIPPVRPPVGPPPVAACIAVAVVGWEVGYQIGDKSGLHERLGAKLCRCEEKKYKVEKCVKTHDWVDPETGRRFCKFRCEYSEGIVTQEGDGCDKDRIYRVAPDN